MSVGLLLLTHETMGGALVNAARHVLGRLTLALDVIEVPASCFDPESTALDASRRALALDEGDGVLVLTDLYGASPSNLAGRLARLGTPVRRVSALSLPMLLRVMNYSEQGLDELPAIAAAGARNGVIHDDA